MWLLEYQNWRDVIISSNQKTDTDLVFLLYKVIHNTILHNRLIGKTIPVFSWKSCTFQCCQELKASTVNSQLQVTYKLWKFNELVIIWWKKWYQKNTQGRQNGVLCSFRAKSPEYTTQLQLAPYQAYAECLSLLMAIPNSGRQIWAFPCSHSITNWKCLIVQTLFEK